jgi:PAS domain S-box-containing protein
MTKHAGNTQSDRLARDAEYLRILAKTLQSGVSILDEDMNYLFLSDSVYENIGTTRAELKPGDPLSKCHDIMLANGLFTPEIMQQQKLSSEAQIRRNADGKPDGIRLVTLGDGSTHRFVRKRLSCGKTVSIADNVSELVEKDKLLDKALALGQSGYWSLDVATKTYMLSNSLYAFFGPDIGHKVQKHGMVSVTHPDDRESFKAALANSRKTNNRFDVTSRSINYKGETRWVTTMGKVIRDAKGQAVRVEAFVRDVTQARQQAIELEQAKDEAIAASKAKSEFLANMSHEIRTPMNGILGMAELLKNSDITERQREFVSVINNSASALLNIINDILDFSKIEAGAFEIDPTPFNFKSSINDVTSLMRTAAQQKGIELIINYPSNLPSHFIGDVGRLRQVVTNLVGNAVKFTESGHITIDVAVETSRNIAVCTLDVKDTGIGISPEKMSRIFEKFTQADGSTTRVYGGTGLGLTISKHIVEMMGGKMHVKSTLGQGSTFGFRVPLPIDFDAKTEAFDSDLVNGKRVLIVDDIGVNRDIFTEQLKAWGLKTEIAIDGVEALVKIRAAQENDQTFDLILLDFLMPGMNGQEFAQLMSQTSSLKSPRIIMLSSCDQPVSSAALGLIGIDSYLIKPVRERRLFDTIVRVFSNPSKPNSAAPPTPIAEADSPQPITQTQTQSKLAPQPEPSGKQEIMVAEDFPLNQDVVRLMLAETPFLPIFVNNGQEAVDLYLENPHRFPLIVMDVSMPVMDGREATRKIRSHEAAAGLERIPIIALTGHALKDDREACLTAGMNAYLSKPVKQVELMEKLETYSGKAIDIQRYA